MRVMNFLMVNGTNKVTCPVCGIHGLIEVNGEEMKVTFPPEQIKRARNTIPGLYEHHNEIGEMMRICIPLLQEKKEFLDEKRKEYAAYKPTWS